MRDNIAEQLLRETVDFANARPVVEGTRMSSPKVDRYLNQLVARMPADERYLEIGTPRQGTVLAAALDNHDKVCVAYDKVTWWGRWVGRRRGRDTFRADVRRLGDRCGRIELHRSRAERLVSDQSAAAPVGVFLYDGERQRETTRSEIEAAAPLLSDRAVVLVHGWDDTWAIRIGARDALKAAGLNVVWARELHSEDGWSRGLGVFFVERREPERVVLPWPEDAVRPVERRPFAVRHVRSEPANAVTAGARRKAL